MNVQSSRYVKNVASSWLAYAATSAIGLIYYPVLVAGLGLSGYGLFVVGATLVGYMMLLEMGVSTAVVRFVSGESDERRKGEFIIAAVVLYVGALLLVGTLLGFLYFTFESIFRVDLPSTRRLTLLAVVFINVALAYVISLVRAWVSSQSLYYVVNAFQVFRLALSLAFIIVAVQLSSPPEVVLLGGGFADAGAVAGMVWVVRHRLPHVSLAAFPLREDVRKILSHAKYTLLNMAGDALLYLSGATIVTRYAGLEQLAVYSIAVLVVDYVRNFHASFVSVLFPTLSSRRDSPEYFVPYYLGFSKALLVCAVPIVMLVAFDGGTMLSVLFPDVARSAALPLLVLIIPAWLLISQQPGTYMLSAMNQHYRRAYVLLCFGIVHVVLANVLASRLGMIGVVISLAVCQLFVFLSVCRVHASVLSIPVRLLVRRVFPAGAVALAVAAVIFTAARAVPFDAAVNGIAVWGIKTALCLLLSYTILVTLNRGLVADVRKLIARV